MRDEEPLDGQRHQALERGLELVRPPQGRAPCQEQLPLDVDEDGFLIATGDFSGPVGPGFWDRDT